MARVATEWTRVKWKWNWRFPFLHRVVTKHKFTTSFVEMMEAWDSVEASARMAAVLNAPNEILRDAVWIPAGRVEE